MRKVMVMVMVAVFSTASSQFEYRVDPKLEKFYLSTIDDLKKSDFEFPNKKGVQIAKIKKKRKGQHKYGVASIVPHPDYSMIRVYSKNWSDIDYWQRRWVMTHEMLHTFGYEHSNDTNSLMYWDVPERVTPVQYYEALEIALKEI